MYFLPFWSSLIEAICREIRHQIVRLGPDAFFCFVALLQHWSPWCIETQRMKQSSNSESYDHRIVWSEVESFPASRTVINLITSPALVRNASQAAFLIGL